MMLPKTLLPAIAAIALATVGDARAGPAPAARQVAQADTAAPARAPDVIYVPTPHNVVEAMLKVAEVDKKDVLYDLGSGDGRIPITAVQKYDVRRAVGVDIDPQRIREAEANRRKARVGDRVRFVKADLFETPIGDATVVTLYLLPSLNLKLLPKLLTELQPGTRVVSHSFDMGSWTPEKALKVDGHDVYFWRIPRAGTPEYEAAKAAAAEAPPR